MVIIMKKALIDTQTSVQYISSWEGISPIYSTYENSARVCEVVENEFPVYETLFWLDCSEDIIADQYYYDLKTKSIKKIINASMQIKE